LSTRGSIRRRYGDPLSSSQVGHKRTGPRTVHNIHQSGKASTDMGQREVDLVGRKEGKKKGEGRGKKDGILSERKRDNRSERKKVARDWFTTGSEQKKANGNCRAQVRPTDWGAENRWGCKAGSSTKIWRSWLQREDAQKGRDKGG